MADDVDYWDTQKRRKPLVSKGLNIVENFPRFVKNSPLSARFMANKGQIDP